jgi:hypothetical protein
MALPPAVQRQLEAAERAEAEILQQQQQAAAVPEPPIEQVLAKKPAAQPEPPPVEPPAASPVPAQEPPKPAPPHDPRQEDPAYWRQRFLTTQGHLQAEKARFDQTMAQMNERLKMLEEQKAKPEPTPKPTADPKDVQEFGQELVEMVRRNTEQMLGHFAKEHQALMADFGQRLMRLEQGVQSTAQTTQVTAEQVFSSQLAGLVPDWQQVNADERFLAWLGQIEPMVGITRQAILDDAVSKLDAQRTSQVFAQFKQTLPQQTLAQPKALEMQVSPSATAGTRVPIAAPSKPTFSNKQVQAFFSDLARGAYRGRETEAQAIEREIDLAAQEGRITP